MKNPTRDSTQPPPQRQNTKHRSTVTPAIMDDFLKEHKAKFQALVAGYKPKDDASASKNAPRAAGTSADITVAARIRPVLDEETDEGALAAVFPRSGCPGTVDLHEIRKTVRGLPALDVRLNLKLANPCPH